MFANLNGFFGAHGALVGLVWVVVFSASTSLVLWLVPGVAAMRRDACGDISKGLYETTTAIEAGGWLSLAFWPTIAGWATIITVMSFIPSLWLAKWLVRKHQQKLSVTPGWKVLSGTKFRDAFGNPRY